MPDDVVADPPPVPVLPPPWSLRPVAASGADLDTVHTWMHRPHVATRWRQAWTRERWARELADHLAGPRCRPCLVAHHGADLAYVEIYRVVHDPLAAHYDAGGHDLGLHVAIGDPDRVGGGLGTALLRVLAAALLDADPACPRIVLEPDAANLPMHRALGKAGFRAVADLALPHKDATLHVLGRLDSRPGVR